MEPPKAEIRINADQRGWSQLVEEKIGSMVGFQQSVLSWFLLTTDD